MKDNHTHKPTTNNNTATPSNIPLLTCAFLAALTTGGPVYAFGLYSGELKTRWWLTQSQLDTIGAANFCAGLFSWIPGLLIDRMGIRLSLIAGGTLGAACMTLYWAVAKQILVVPDNHVIGILCGLGVFMFATNSLVVGSIFKLLVATCAPHTKGSLVGVAKGYVGLGSGVYACLFSAIKSPQIDDLDFLPLAALLALGAAALPAFVLLPGSHQEMVHLLEATPVLQLDQTTRLHLQSLYFGLTVLAIMVVGTTLVSLIQDDYDNYAQEPYHVELEPPPTPHYIKAVLIVVAWLAPILALLVIPTKSQVLHQQTNNHDDNHHYETIQDIVQEIENESDTEENDQDNDEEYGSNNDDNDKQDFLPLLQTHSSPALAYGAEITDSVQVSGPRGMLGRKAVHPSIRSSSSTSTLNTTTYSSIQSTMNSDEKNCATQPQQQQPPQDHPSPRIPNMTLGQVLQTTPAWVFAWITIIRAGGGTMVTNNMGQMVESLRLPRHTTTPAALALFSFGQAASRVATGAISDWALSWKIPCITGDGANNKNNVFSYRTWHNLQLQGVPRPAFLIVASLAGTFAHIFMSFTTTRNWFLVGVCFSGAAFGMIWPLMVLIVGEVFGTTHMGANYMFFDGLASGLGTLLLSKYIAQDVYEDHIVKSVAHINGINTKNNNDMDGRTCYGQACFFESHILIAILSFTCVLASVWFYRATRHVYAVTATKTRTTRTTQEL